MAPSSVGERVPWSRISDMLGYWGQNSDYTNSDPMMDQWTAHLFCGLPMNLAVLGLHI